MPTSQENRDAVHKAINELQRLKVGANPQALGEDAVNVQRIQALLTGVNTLALLDIGDQLKKLTDVISSNS